jgi:response regulator RpfG family c-di-GMP phosphodiesterase
MKEALEVLEEFTKNNTSKTDEISYRRFFQFYLDTIDYLISLLELDHSIFRGHAHNVARLSKVVAHDLNLSEKKIDEIILASYFHEFYNILKEKEKTESKEILKDFLAKINPPFSIQRIINDLDENYDGGGPEHKKNEEIDIGAKIIKAVCLFDNESKNKEHKYIEKEKAFRILREAKEKSLDPNIVDDLILIIKSEMTYDKAISSINEAPKIFILSKDANISNLLKLKLLNEGYKVELERELELSKILIGKNKPDLVIVDMEFTLNLSLFIKNEYKHFLPFIIMVNEHEDVNIDRVIELEAEDIIKKPTTIENAFLKTKKILNKIMKRPEKIDEIANYFQSIGSFYKAGDLYREIGDLGNAALMYEKAEDLGLAAEMYLALDEYEKAAFLYEKIKKYDLALTYYEKGGNSIKQNEMLDLIGNFYNAGLMLYNRGKFDAAIIELQKASIHDKDFKKSQSLLGKIFIKQDHNNMAITSLDKAISEEKIGPININIFYDLAVCYFKEKQYEKAINLYETILGESYDYLDVLTKLGEAKEKFEYEKQEEEKRKKQARFIVPSNILESDIKRYEKLSELGRGGMGIVYKAQDTVLDRIVALKVLSAALQNDRKVVETFIREAKSAACLNHLNIVTVYDAGILEGSYYIAMEYIDGSTIREILKTKKLATPSVIGILKQVLYGLIYAHSKNIVHRDLTTNNVMLTNNRVVKIMDFGLARVIKQLMSEQSIIGGTPSYMSPEQVEGDPIDHRTDIYTLGVSIFEMATGEVPFKKGDLGYHHLHTPPPNPQSINSKIPDILNNIILKCLQKDPANRFQKAQEILDELKKL